MTTVVEMIISGFISKIVNEVVDAPLNPIKNAIKDADKNRRDKNQSIETRIYQVTIDAIKEFTRKEYKGKDVLYDAAESILKGLIRNKDDKVEAVRAGLKMLVSQVTSETCEDFLWTLCYVICKKENRDLAVEVIILQQEQTNGYVQEGFRRTYLNDEEINQKLDYLIKELIDKKVHEERYVSEFPIINRADEYVQRWNKNVFLNDFNEEDENAGTEIKLSEIYIEECLPHYIWRTNIQSKDILRNLLTKYVININDKKMLLILGQPGIGKSTLITWIMANLVEKKETILVYQFASDLKKVNWQGDDILEEIFEALRLGNEELENRVLILDGFDEISIGGDRERILNKLNQELEKKNYLKKFTLIITCRENYVNKLELGEIEYITLQAWNEAQIRSFCEIYEKVIINKGSESTVNRNSKIKISTIIEKKDIMGIPLILYMVLALNVDIGRSSSTVDIYDQIFSVKRGGIYDRCYDSEHRINKPEIKKCIHQISQKIAFWIFENNDDEAFIYQKNFKEICDIVMSEVKNKSEDMQSNVLIGSYFKIKHCEGELADEVNFVHRSIYEYFAAVYFFESISNLTSKKDVAGKLGVLLENGHLSKQILEFIKCKFDSVRGYNLPDITKKIFNIMLQEGMTYNVIEKKKDIFRDYIKQEENIFSNMLEIVHLWNPVLGECDDRIKFYIEINKKLGLNLRGIRLKTKIFVKEERDMHIEKASLIEADLRQMDLRGADLRGANLESANLVGANLSRADLGGAYLKGAYLGRVDLSRANLGDADLEGANLNRTYLDRADLRGANLSRADLEGADLSGADLREADLREANLNGANLGGANLGGADLREANLEEANLGEANLIDVKLNKAIMKWANLGRAYLKGAYLGEIDLEGAQLCRADLRGAYLCRANFKGANLRETIFDSSQVGWLNQLSENYDLSDCIIYILETGERVSYREYCISKLADVRHGSGKK